MLFWKFLSIKESAPSCGIILILLLWQWHKLDLFSYGCLYLNYVDGYAARMFLFCFFFGTACSAILFAVATGTTISSSLGRQYGPVLSLSFLDVYGFTSYIWIPVRATAQGIFLRCLWYDTKIFAVATGTSCTLGRRYGPVLSLSFLDVYDVAPLCLQWPMTQLFPAAWAGSTGHCSAYLS